MATAVCMKRMRREREQLARSDSKEFSVHFNDEDLRNFTAFVSGPEDSLYRHKFIKLKFEIPDSYPLVPPKVKFVQWSGGRIHPNLYTEGKVCLSILGTWPGEPWATAMNVESVLITIRSLLDNKPYLHEPNQRDNPGYNDFVRYTTWQCLLLDHLQYERDPEHRKYLLQYLEDNGDGVLQDLEDQSREHANAKTFRSAYGGGSTIADYASLIGKLKPWIPKPSRTVPAIKHGREDTNDKSPLAVSSNKRKAQEVQISIAQSVTESNQPKKLKRKASHETGDEAHPIDVEAKQPKICKTSYGTGDEDAAVHLEGKQPKKQKKGPGCAVQ